jgi:hypothetical protein
MVNNKPKWITAHKANGSKVWKTNEEMESSHVAQWQTDWRGRGQKLEK